MKKEEKLLGKRLRVDSLSEGDYDMLMADIELDQIMSYKNEQGLSKSNSHKSLKIS
jgi:hypothetical protein